MTVNEELDFKHLNGVGIGVPDPRIASEWDRAFLKALGRPETGTAVRRSTSTMWAKVFRQTREGR
jgi:hypothetical protein